jgi:competence protein ComEC
VEPGNDASLVLEAELPGLRAVFLGDLGEEAQARLLRRSPPSAADVVKVSHHGSADQSPRLYERLAAPVALISAGAGNDYGHPAPSLLALLDDVGSAAFRTDRSGMLLVAPGPAGVEVWTERPDEPDEPERPDEPRRASRLG